MGKGSAVVSKYFLWHDETLKMMVTHGLWGMLVNSLKLACGKIVGLYTV